MKMTPWFEGTQKPVRIGLYQQICGFGVSVGYQYWDGAAWHAWGATRKEALAERDSTPAFTQKDKWRGLVKKTPNVKLTGAAPHFGAASSDRRERG